jgi:hypothetical protein
VVEHVLVDVVVGLRLRPGEHGEAEATERLHPALQRARRLGDVGEHTRLDVGGVGQ